MTPSPPLHQSAHRGSVIISVLLMALVVISTVTIYLRSAVQEMKYAERTFALQQSINFAEMGAEAAIYSLNSDDWSGWTKLAADEYYRAYSPIGDKETIYTYVDKRIDSNVKIASGSIMGVTNGSVEKQIFIRLGYRSFFVNGLMAKEEIVMNGNRIKIDSYNSDLGAYNVNGNRFDNGTVASNSVEVESVQVQNADILGFVATGGAQPQVGSQGSIKGFDTPNGVKIDTNRVATDFYQEFPDVEMPVSTGASTSLTSAFLGFNGAKTLYHLPELVLKNSTSLFVLGEVGLVLDTNLDIGGELLLMPGAKLTLYIKGDLHLGGAGILNLSGKPENLVIYGVASEDEGQTIKMHGLGQMAAVIYAPNADLELKGGGVGGALNKLLGTTPGFYGAAVAKNITITGNYDFHYDEALGEFSPDNSYRMKEWRELTDAKDRLPLQQPHLMTTSNNTTLFSSNQ